MEMSNDYAHNLRSESRPNLACLRELSNFTNVGNNPLSSSVLFVQRNECGHKLQE